MAEKQYRQTKTPINSSLTVVQDNDYNWGAIDEDGNIVIPFGKYAWIDGFQNGLAKVIGHNDTTSPRLRLDLVYDDNDLNIKKERVAEQGIINENGEEVLPLEYTVWKFYEKEFPTIKYFKGTESHTVTYESLNPDLLEDDEWGIDDDDDDDSYDYNDPYDRYDDYDDYNDYNDRMRDTWDAMTDGMYGDMPDGFDGDFDFLGY